MNKSIVWFDLEANNKDIEKITKIHCLCYLAFKDGKYTTGTLTKLEDIKKFAVSYDLYVGHNIIRFDNPVIKKFTRVLIPYHKSIDTLGLSWWFFPEFVGAHGLNPWGARVGIPKPEVEDWEDQPLEVYVNRCEEDVKITKKVYDAIFNRIRKVYAENLEDIKRMNSYNSFKLYCAYLQSKYKLKLDINALNESLDKMLYTIEQKVEALQEFMPEVPKKVKKKRPKLPYRKDGTLSKVGATWFDLLKERGLPEDYEGEVEVITRYDPPNPNSSKQVKDWLHSLGWKPKTFTYVSEPDGSKRAIEQVRKGGKLCESVLDLKFKSEGVEILEGLTVLNHRSAILKSFLKNKDENNFIEAGIAGYTNTMRFRHKTLVNLPGVSGKHKPEEGVEDYADGTHIRGCLVASDGYELCGSDVSSLEDTTKQHYMYKYDPEYVKMQQQPGYDPHLAVAVAAGLLTEEEAEEHKSGKVDHSKKRKKAKVVNFSSIYGVGAKTLSLNLDISVSEAEKLLEGYWKLNYSVKLVSQSQRTKTFYIEYLRYEEESTSKNPWKAKQQMWLYNPVSRFWYSLRYEKDIFSTLNQGTGVYCFDTWVKHVLKKRPQLSGQFHDEIVLELKKGNRDKMNKILEDAMIEANKELKLNTTLGIDTKFGHSYADVH